MYLRLTLFSLVLPYVIICSILLQTVSHNAGGLENIHNVAHHLVGIVRVAIWENS